MRKNANEGCVPPRNTEYEAAQAPNLSLLLHFEECNPSVNDGDIKVFGAAKVKRWTDKRGRVEYPMCPFCGSKCADVETLAVHMRFCDKRDAYHSPAYRVPSALRGGSE